MPLPAAAVFPDVAVLLAGLGLLHFPDERRPVRLGVIADGLEHIRHQGQDYLFRDTMLGRTASANGDFAVLGASVLRGTLAVVGAVNIHLAAAIGTVNQPGQRRGLTKTVRIAFGVAPDALHTVEGFLVDDGLMGILENRPFAFINIVAFLVLEMLSGLEIDGMAQVFPPFKDIDNGGGRPLAGVFNIPGLVQALTMPRHVDGGHLDFISGQAAGNLKRPIALQCHSVDTSYHVSGLAVHNPVFPLFVPQVAIGDKAGQVLAAHALGLEYRLDFAARVTGVKLVHDIQEWGHVIVPFVGVNIVVNGNQPHSPLAKNFHYLTDFQIVTSETAHVLDDDCLHAAVLDFLHHRHEAGPVKASAGNAVISEMLETEIPIPAGEVLQHDFDFGLKNSPLQFIVTAQPLVQQRNLGFCHSTDLLE